MSKDAALHELFRYVVTEKQEHAKICLAMKRKKLKCLRRRILQLAKRIELYAAKKAELQAAYQATGQPVFKKEWMLANLENKKHVIKIKFMIDLEESLAKMIQQEESLLEHY